MNNTVYLVPCSFEENDFDEFYEVYVTDDNGRADRVCNTKLINTSIVELFEILYDAASASADNVYLDDTVKDIINQYRANKKERSNKV